MNGLSSKYNASLSQAREKLHVLCSTLVNSGIDEQFGIWKSKVPKGFSPTWMEPVISDDG